MHLTTFVFTIMLFLSTIGTPGAVEFNHPATVKAGLAVLQHTYPDWQKQYKADEFDCSEMSALVAQYFKIAGYTNVVVKTGYYVPEGKDHLHVWVVVDGKTIEVTKLSIVKNTSLYHARQSMLSASETDWWNSKYMLDNGLHNILHR